MSRIRAMDKANEILRETSWQQTPVRVTIESALNPHRTGEGRVSPSGPEAHVKPHQALAMALAVNELATNATKYGSLSVSDGKVDVRWSLEERDGLPQFVFRWLERGGPRVAEPVRKGFGTRVTKVYAGD